MKQVPFDRMQATGPQQLVVDAANFNVFLALDAQLSLPIVNLQKVTVTLQESLSVILDPREIRANLRFPYCVRASIQINASSDFVQEFAWSHELIQASARDALDA